MKTRTLTVTLKGLLIVSLLWATQPAPVLAAGVVGTGTPASCTEAALTAALAGGGTVTFNCGAAPHTILSSSAKAITVSTTIDGGGTITLDGQDGDRLFVVSNGAVLTLRNIVLAHGFSSGDGGAIHNGSAGADTPGAVVLENSTIRDSIANLSGGAIVSTGPLTITNSLLEGNEALNGGALYPRFAGARTTITNSTLRYNRATDTTDGYGGAMLVWDGAPVTIQGGEIYRNTARTGGGIYAFANSSLTLSGSALRGNSADFGGGLTNRGTATLTGVTFRGNTAGAAGGGLFNVGTATLTGVTLSGNWARYDGGGVFNSSEATLWAWNSTIDGNSTPEDGGGISNYGTTNLYNVTVSHNVADSDNDGLGVGGGVYNKTGATFNTRNTLLAVNYQGIRAIFPLLHDCSGVIWSAHSRFTSMPVGCSIVGPSSFFTDPNGIGPLADNGGPTLTVALLPGSHAIDAADPVLGCVNFNGLLATDQRGAPRIAGARCDVGAYEFGSLLPRNFLPLLIR
jgi:hypothetical protein